MTTCEQARVIAGERAEVARGPAGQRPDGRALRAACRVLDTPC